MQRHREKNISRLEPAGLNHLMMMTMYVSHAIIIYTVEPHSYGHEWAKKIWPYQRVTILMRVFLQENVWAFCQAAKKSGCNNEVTVLLEVAIRQGFTLFSCHVFNF